MLHSFWTLKMPRNAVWTGRTLGFETQPIAACSPESLFTDQIKLIMQKKKKRRTSQEPKQESTHQQQQRKKAIGLRLTFNTSTPWISAEMHKYDRETLTCQKWPARSTGGGSHTHADGRTDSNKRCCSDVDRWLTARTPDLLEELQPSCWNPCGKPTTCLDVGGEELVKLS